MTRPATAPILLSSATSYRTVAELGRGGMGTVFLALSEGAGGFERLVALKRMHQNLVKSPQAIERFLNEARLAAHVHHANVVGIQQVGGDGENYFLVLDYVDGEGLDIIVRRATDADEPMPVPVALRIILDALAGLGAVHDACDAVGTSLGILHRDVSPQNVLVGRDGTARLADFGLAKCRGSRVITDANYVVGKLLYSAPEYLRHELVGRELDIYAIGVTLWTALMGHEPLPDHTEAQMLHQVLLDGIPPLPVSERIPQALADIVAECCAPDIARRFGTAAEVSHALETFGRRHDMIATHAEVAQFVDQTCGAELSMRRRRMASELERARLMKSDPARTLTIRASTVEAALETTLPTAPTPVRIPVPEHVSWVRSPSSKRSTAKPTYSLAAIGVLVAIAALALFTAPSGVRSPATAQPVAAARVVSPGRPFEIEPTAAPRLIVEAPPAPPAPIAEAPVAPRVEAPRPPVTRPATQGVARVTRSKALVGPAPRGALSDTIRVRNPYR